MLPAARVHMLRACVTSRSSTANCGYWPVPRIGADHLGHSRISTTQDKYMARGRVHTAVADMLDRTINDE